MNIPLSKVIITQNESQILKITSNCQNYHKTQGDYLEHITRFKRYILYILEEQNVTRSYVNIIINQLSIFA